MTAKLLDPQVIAGAVFSERTEPVSARNDIVIGVEIEPEIIRAVTYDATLISRGKARRSTKLARGTTAVLGRVARCVADAADEGDLPLAHIGAVGVAIPGHVEHSPDRAVTSASLNWSNVPLEQVLETHLNLPVRVGNRFHLSARAVWLRDLHQRAGIIAMLFLDSTLGGAILRDGRLLDAAKAPEFHRLIEAGQSVWAQRIPADWRNRATRNWRKALKRGEPAIRGFVEESLPELGRLIAQLARGSCSDVIVIGGGLMEDRRAVLLEKILAHARVCSPSTTDLDRRVVASELGENAVLVGAAMLARDEIPRMDAPRRS